MANKFIINFPIQAVKGTGNTMQAILEFNTTSIGDDTITTAEAQGLRIEKYGSLNISYDLEDAFMVPGTYSIEIGDAQSVLDSLFFGKNFSSIIPDKQAKLSIKVNNSNKFIGHVIEDKIYLNTGTKKVKFSAAPKTDAINKRMIFDEDSNVLNPFSYTSKSYYRIISILEDIFGLVNPAISYSAGSLNLINDWQFQGTRDESACNLNNITFSELFQLIDPLFFDSSFGLRNCGDVLKKLAIDWCSFTGLISYDKAFFKKLFHYNPNNLQQVNVYKWEKGYRYGLIDYVKVTTGIDSPNEPYTEGVFTKLEERYLTRKSLPGFFIASGSSGSNIKAVINRSNHYVFDHGSTLDEAPSEGATYTVNGNIFQVVGTPVAGTVTRRVSTVLTQSGGLETPSSGTLIILTGTGPASITYSSYGNANGTYTIYQARDPRLFDNQFKDHGRLLAKFWHTNRGNILNCRVDKFTFKGINYDFLKDFPHAGSRFQPITMDFKHSENYTICEAIYLGEEE